MAPALVPEAKAALRGVDLDRSAPSRRLGGARGRQPRPPPARSGLACCNARDPEVSHPPSGSRYLERVALIEDARRWHGAADRAVPVVMALVLDALATPLAAVVFLVAAATDWVDGRLARPLGGDHPARRRSSTRPPTSCWSRRALIGLVAVDRASPWVALIIVGREFTILGLRAAVESGGRAIRDLDVRQVEGDGSVRRDRARDPAPGRDHRRRVPRSVGDGDRGASSPRGPESTTSFSSPPRSVRSLREPRIRHRRDGGDRHRARDRADRAGRRGRRARALGRRRPGRSRPAAPVSSAARATTRTTLRGGWRAARSCSTSPGSTSCASRTRARWSAMNVGGAGRRGARRGPRRRRPARAHVIGGDDRRGAGGRRHRADAAPRLVPVDVRADQDRGRAGRPRYLARGRAGSRPASIPPPSRAPAAPAAPAGSCWRSSTGVSRCSFPPT